MGKKRELQEASEYITILSARVELLEKMLDELRINNKIQPLEGNIQVRDVPYGNKPEEVVSHGTLGGKAQARGIEDTSWGLNNGLFAEVLSIAKDVRYKAYAVRDTATNKADALTGGQGADLCEEREPANSFMTDLLYTLLDARDALDRTGDRLESL